MRITRRDFGMGLVGVAGGAAAGALIPGILQGPDGEPVRAWRAADFNKGALIWDSGYSDMPYLADLGEGRLFSTLTVTRGGSEGGAGQHVIGVVSEDGGATWGSPVEIEPAGPPVSAWAMPYRDAATGHLYVFYLYNADNILEIRAADGTLLTRRPDVVGYIAWRMSSDEGRTWSERQVVDIPTSDIDTENPYGGSRKIFWCCGHPRVHDGQLYLGLSKCGPVVVGRFFHRTESFLMKAPFPALDEWSMCPSSGRGMKGGVDPQIAPTGAILGEEPSFVIFDDGVIYAVNRSSDGYVADAYSTDGGATFTNGWARELDDSTPIPQPRAKCAIMKIDHGRYFMWHHNAAAVSAADDPAYGSWDYRFNVMYRLGERKGNRILWSAPAALLYEPKPTVRISYPSFVVSGDDLVIAATNKAQARLFRVPLAAL